jgi:hypothetical protein
MVLTVGWATGVLSRQEYLLDRDMSSHLHQPYVKCVVSAVLL